MSYDKYEVYEEESLLSAVAKFIVGFGMLWLLAFAVGMAVAYF